MTGFATYYVEANIICMLVFGILWLHNRFNIDRQEKQIKFDRVLIGFMLYFLVDCFWALMIAGNIPKNRSAVIAVSFLLCFFMAAVIYFWLEFVMAYEYVPHRNRTINKFAVLFPFLVSTIAMILNSLFAPYSLINESLDAMAGFNVYLIAVPAIYLIAILFYTIRKAKNEKQMAEKRKHIFVGILPLMVIAGGLVQMLFFPYIPIYCFSAMILMLIFYIQSLELRISIDPLTQLNNRSQLKHYTSQRSNLFLENRMTVVIMMDIDGFKAINDTYGHSEGDNALVVIADSLKKVVNSHSMPSFLCRYGGDEFILIAHPVAKEEIEQLIREIRGEIERNVKGSPYPLALSVGYDELMGGRDTIQSCIQRADKKLYLDKEYRKIRMARSLVI